MENKTWPTWEIKIAVHPSWVADGFNFEDADQIVDMMQERLRWASSFEIEAEIVKAPDPKLIDRIQNTYPEGFEE